MACPKHRCVDCTDPATHHKARPHSIVPTILVDNSLRSDQLGITTPSVPGYGNIIRVNPDRIADPVLYYTDGNGRDTIPYSLVDTLSHENLHLVIQEMGFSDPGGDWTHKNVMKPYIDDVLKRVLNATTRTPTRLDGN